MRRTLVVYGESPRADASLRAAARAGTSLTVVTLARQEREGRRCCDIRSVFWNRVQRELAQVELDRARLAVDDDERVTLDVLGFAGGSPADAIAERAAALDAGRILLADPRASGLGRRALRRLRRRSPVPVADGA